eukprot:3933012-Rhodomonas_salina.5
MQGKGDSERWKAMRGAVRQCVAAQQLADAWSTWLVSHTCSATQTAQMCAGAAIIHGDDAPIDAGTADTLTADRGNRAASAGGGGAG